MSFSRTCFALAASLLSVAASAADYGNYGGKGGMTAYSIKPNVYEYHFDKGFVGPDAGGWDPNLQYAWSRIAGATVCGVPVSLEKMLPLLIKKFEQDELTHKMIGIDFHAAQMRANKKFCTDERIAEISAAIPKFESGDFPAKF
ncbi:MAG TPA: hypothetical protein VGC21_13690 [Telluria sp.]